jgi:hypothetical protein
LKKLIKILFFLFVNYNIHATSGSVTNKYNLQHPASFPSVYIPDKETCNVMLLLVQEIKRDIIYRRMNLPQSAQQVTHPQRLIAHLDSSIHRLHSYLSTIYRHCKILQAHGSSTASMWNKPWVTQLRELVPCFHPNFTMTIPTYPLPTLHKQTTLCRLGNLTKHTCIYTTCTILQYNEYRSTPDT